MVRKNFCLHNEMNTLFIQVLADKMKRILDSKVLNDLNLVMILTRKD